MIISVGVAIPSFATTSHSSSRSNATCDPPHHSDALLRKVLTQFRGEERIIRKRWEDDEEFGFRKLPPRAWPPYQPSPDALPELRKKAASCNTTTSSSSSATSTLPLHENSECNKVLFDLASCLAFNNLDGPAAMQLYGNLAAAGHMDSHVALGVMLVEGLGCDCDVEAGVAHLVVACEADNAQGLYELGTAIYCGTVDRIPSLKTGQIRQIRDANSEAFVLFEKAATQAHVGGSFMAGEMLLEGEGCEQNVERAVLLVMQAAEAGHRFGRQRMRQLFDSTR